jgi:hypothetical protein
MVRSSPCLESNRTPTTRVEPSASVSA